VAAVQVEARLKELGLTLPTPPTPIGAYLLAQPAGDLLFLSGTTCYTEGGFLHLGRLGAELTVDQGYAAARQAALNLLSVIRAQLGDLDHVQRIIKLNGYVNSAPDFDRQPAVINGASDLLEQVFGARGRHARTSIGVSDLPGHIPVEIELIVQVRPADAPPDASQAGESIK
jgi:enamine deaminase RidA (YjgF/YER057c/UK114 family)